MHLIDTEIALASDRATLEGLTQFLAFERIWSAPKPLNTNRIGGKLGTRSRRAIISCLTARKSLILKRRDVRVVEGARLESVCRGNSTVGSNPTLSAILLFAVFAEHFAQNQRDSRSLCHPLDSSQKR